MSELKSCTKEKIKYARAIATAKHTSKEEKKDGKSFTCTSKLYIVFLQACEEDRGIPRTSKGKKFCTSAKELKLQFKMCPSHRNHIR